MEDSRLQRVFASAPAGGVLPSAAANDARRRVGATSRVGTRGVAPESASQGIDRIVSRIARRIDSREVSREVSREAGFTLIELMMVLVLVAVLLGIGGPSFQNSLQRNRMQSTLNEMAGALSFARSEAVIRNHAIGMCPTTTPGGNCSGNSWEAGYLIFADDGEGGGNAADGVWNGTEEQLRVGDAAAGGITVRTVGFQGAGRIVFAADGRVQQGLNGTVVICDDRGAAEARGLVVTVAGQPRFAVDTDDSGIVEDHSPVISDVVCP
ncbi:MAG: GspH/FimT family pseudopilin [Pseudomonadota bacterium]